MKYYSQFKEDEFLYEKYLNYKNGFFIELGAVDGITYSNTKFFEDELNWTGILIEPTTQYNKLIINRPNCNNFNYAISEVNGEVEFLGTYATAGVLDTLSEQHINRWKLKDSYLVQSKPFNNITKNLSIPMVDLFSIDVEGGELQVLKTFDWRIPVYLILLETNGDSNVTQINECRNLLTCLGFKLESKVSINEVWINHNNKRMVN
jgi:FkbM family methyltransferase